MLEQMGTENSTAQQPIRQRSPLALAVACGVTGVALLVSAAWQWSDNPQPLFVAGVVFGLAVVWSLFVRPAVLLDEDGVTLRNVVRDVHLPWIRVTDVDFRWNLKVFAGDRAYTAWGISSQVERPRGASAGMLPMLPGRLDMLASADARKLASPAPKVTASMVARSIESAMDDYAEALARGERRSVAPDEVRVTWVPMAVITLLVPAIAVVVLTMI